jgi:hypothetical protein
MTRHRESIKKQFGPPHIKLGLRGIFLLQVKHADGTRDFYKTKNLVVNQGLDAIGSGPPSNVNGNCIAGIAVGTSNTAPAAGNTTLGAGIGFTTNLTSSTLTFPSTVAPYVVQNNYVFTFSVGGAVGNIAEIGALLASENATGRVFSRALIQVGGSPGTITLLSTDQLIVTYQLQTIMTADITGTLNVITDGASVAVNYTIRPIGMASGSASPFSNQRPKIAVNTGGSFPGWFSGISNASSFAAVTSQPNVSGSATWQPAGTAVLGSYTAGTHQIVATHTLTTGHPVNFQYATFAFTWFSFQLLLASAQTYLTTQTYSWPITISWAAV